MPEILSLFSLGVVYGLTICSLSCLPYLSTYLMSTGKGFRDGVNASFVFISGKLLIYSALGGMAAYIGSKLVVNDFLHLKYTIGGILIAVGLLLPFISKGGCNKKHQRTGKRISLFALGISSSLIPCPSLVSMSLLAANKGSVLIGASYGLIFGLGLMISPLVIASGLVSLISKAVKVEVKGFAPWLNALSVIIIVMMGVRVLTLEI
ncbi:MAG: sulfite exporter TauE/SafE family protein [bacterium]|nr:sulfite exporter TauE/SafE family protein [bacterium]